MQREAAIMTFLAEHRISEISFRTVRYFNFHSNRSQLAGWEIQNDKEEKKFAGVTAQQLLRTLKLAEISYSVSATLKGLPTKAAYLPEELTKKAFR